MTSTTWVVTLRWIMSAISVAILSALAARSAREEEWPGVALFGLTAIAATVSQVLWTRRKLREGQPVERLERSFDLSRQREDVSLLGRLNEFGWNALPAYLAVLGGLFLVSGLAAGDLRSAGFGGLLVGIGVFKRRQEGAWYRRL